jgi:hypothetical protein
MSLFRITLPFRRFNQLHSSGSILKISNWEHIEHSETFFLRYIKIRPRPNLFVIFQNLTFRITGRTHAYSRRSHLGQFKDTHTLRQVGTLRSTTLGQNCWETPVKNLSYIQTSPTPETQTSDSRPRLREKLWNNYLTPWSRIRPQKISGPQIVIVS